MSDLLAAGIVGAVLFFVRGKWIRRQNRLAPRTQTFRRVLIQKYGKRCMACGKTRRTGGIEAHHIVEKSKGGSNDPLKNGVLLCRRCHQKAHEGKLSRRYLRRLR